LSLPIIWMLRDRMAHSAKYWAAGWLVTSWLAITALHLTGLWGDYDPQLKRFLLQANVQEVLRSQRVSFIVDEKALNRDDRKTQLLLNFYTPKIGQEIENPKILPNTDYAWIDPNLAKTPGLKYEVIDVFKGWNLARRWQQAK
jgi:hypothetical protein